MSESPWQVCQIPPQIAAFNPAVRQSPNDPALTHNAAVVVDNVTTMVVTDVPAPNERQARELAKLPPEKQPEAWAKAVETAPNPTPERGGPSPFRGVWLGLSRSVVMQDATALSAHPWIDNIVAKLPDVCTLAEASQAVRLSRRTLSRLIRAERIKAARLTEGGSSRVLIPKEEIAKLLRSMAGEP